MPYLWANAVNTHLTGVPMMRAMVVDFGYDRNVLALDTQYMLGESLLVAPVLSPDGECSFYLPDAGVWTDIQTGERLQGGKWYTRTYDYFGMPLFAKPNSIIIYGDFHDTADYDYTENMHIAIYGIGDGEACEATVYDRNGAVTAMVRAARFGNDIKLSVKGTDKKFTFECPEGLEVIV
jgi:alpha-D-xyloside xylohydrolase